MPCKKTQNDYIWEWLPQKAEFLWIILEMEAPPDPQTCGRYCCCAMHQSNPFHQIEQWTGEFFERSALHLLGLAIHLGHGGAPCLYSEMEHPTEQGDKAVTDLPKWPPFDSEEWVDVDDIPLNLQPPIGKKYLTIVDITGIHYMIVNSCQCPNAEDYHLQLLQAKLWPSTFQKPSTTFTFAVLDDFLRDNLECRTSGMNYFSKLCQIASGLYPHIVPILGSVRVVQQWQLIKLEKWNGFWQTKGSPLRGDLVLFCVACLQPGINMDLTKSLHELVAKITAYVPMLTLQSWKYTHAMVMDRNFKAEHIKERCPEDQVWLMDGCGYMVKHGEYQEYLKDTPHITEVLVQQLVHSMAVSTPTQWLISRKGKAILSRNKYLWRKQEESALREQVDDCTVMDMFEIKPSKGKGWEHTAEDMEIDGANNGVSATPVFDGEDFSEDDGTDISMDSMPPSQQQPIDPLPLPSTLSIQGQLTLGLQNLADMELEL
ncbi:hypothetical protein EDC04DRAFT_2597990 [Pisolithus marmoratus]|nr:hypothetical protein EDC04DRAFT_2597990 [Pisolithus marmoratus]